VERGQGEKAVRVLQWILIALLGLLVLFSSQIVTLYTEYLWFQELGYPRVFMTILLTQIILGLVFGLLFFIIFYSNVLLARALAPRYRVSYLQGVIQLYSPVVQRYLNVLLVGLALFFSLIAGISASSYWDVFLRYLNATPFGLADPIYTRDIGFYFFTLPVFRFVWGFLLVALLASSAVAFIIHVLDGAIRLEVGVQKFAPHVKAHLSVLAGLFFLVVAWGYHLQLYSLLYSRRGVVFGASYTDVHAQLPAYQILSVIAAVTAILFLVNIYFRGWRLPAAAVSLLVVTMILVGGIYPALVQQYRVSPNEIEKERPYIKRDIDYTRKAYGLEKIKSQPYPAREDLTVEVIQRNEATTRNIRLWDWRPLRKTFNQIQSIRLYYNFADVDIDRYVLNGQYQQVTLAARELSVEQLPETAKTWINQHLVYTHGFGIVMNPVNKISGEGLPDLVVKDIPPVSKVIKIDRPEIYYGEQTNDYVVVNTKVNEFDYPRGDQNVYTKYKGSGGIPISSSTRRSLFALRFASLRLLLSDAITGSSRVLFHRNITERVNNIARFLHYDGDPYIVIAEDPTRKGTNKLYWLYDAYTVSDMYPYSRPFDGKNNYIRNSVKVAIDAYNGTTTYYVIDEKDPLIRTYMKIFPTLFKPIKEMPESLKRHIRYPEDLFDIQTRLFATYHMLDPQVFYNKEDLWDVPNETVDGEVQPMDPYYAIMRLPEEAREEFLLIRPFTPANKNNMIAWMAARSDFPNYGTLLVYAFPKERLIFGPMQIEARINQDASISQFLTLVDQRGSRVTRGPLLVIPIENSIIYVQPLYIQAEQGELPELKRVFVSYAHQVVMEPSLDVALNRLFAGAVAPPPTVAVTPVPGAGAPGPDIQSLISQAVDHFNRAMEFQRAGNWAGYGEEIAKLQDILNQLKTQTTQ
jgi:uncharacterized membrane protein (UPF0182 family)